MTLDLNELANMPGYGRAQEVVRNKGFWREEYTFDDMVDMLSNKDVLISKGDKILCDFRDYEFDDCLEIELRKAMEA